LPSFERGTPWPLRESATTTVASAVDNGLDPDLRVKVEAAAHGLSPDFRRRLELSLALSDGEEVRQRLERLLAASTADLAALEAAEALLTFEALTPLEKWRIGSTFYRHALFDRATLLLEDLAEVRIPGISRDQVPFTLGRCAFRQARWNQAIGWYSKAMKRAPTAERKAEIEVHIGRVYELAGDIDQAVDAAVRAVRFKTTDDRRLFLARLRLRRGETDLAVQGISRLRGRTARARGEVLLALDALRRGNSEAARNRLSTVRRRPWASPASVVAARLALEAGDHAAAIDMLEGAAPGFDAFWSQRARMLMASLTEAEKAAWRERNRRKVDGGRSRSSWRALGTWAKLEPDPAQRTTIERRVGLVLETGEKPSTAWFPPGLAAELWSIGLEAEAGRWDPTGFPTADAGRSAWTAARFTEFGMPWMAVRMADGAWRQAGSEVPMDVYPVEFQKTAFPLPNREEVTRAARASGVDWSLLAAVAREESRWNPRALSAAGARGLVQLMPATAVTVADRLGMPPPTPDVLFDPRTSLTLGAAELSRLLAEFGGHHAPAIAAYNAGEHQARLWLQQCGSDCPDDLYVANISFSATRIYTSTVLAGASTYSDLYGEEEESAAVID